MNTNFIMDCENWILENKWNTTPPKGKERLGDSWRTLIIDFTEVQLKDYIEYVISGEGEEWFLE
jgi:hypothetical protein